MKNRGYVVVLGALICMLVAEAGRMENMGAEYIMVSVGIKAAVSIVVLAVIAGIAKIVCSIVKKGSVKTNIVAGNQLNGVGNRLKNAQEVETVPVNGDLHAAYYAMKNSNTQVSSDDLLAAYFTRWMEKGYIRMECPEGLGKKLGHKAAIVLTGEGAPKNPLELDVFYMFKEAAGKEKKLWEKDFEKWGFKNAGSLNQWRKEAEKEGESYFFRYGGIQETAVKGAFGMGTQYQKNVTMTGLLMIDEVLGYCKYLKNNGAAEGSYEYQALYGLEKDFSQEWKLNFDMISKFITCAESGIDEGLNMPVSVYTDRTKEREMAY